jgi:hypothetical protein
VELNSKNRRIRRIARIIALNLAGRFVQGVGRSVGEELLSWFK